MYSRVELFLKKQIKPAPVGNVFFAFFKAKMKKNFNKFDFYFVQVENQFAYFGGIK